MTVPCGHCEGTGQIEMPPTYGETFEAITRAWQTSIQIGAHTPSVAHTTICNRLAWLHRKGAIERRGNVGRGGYEWRRR